MGYITLRDNKIAVKMDWEDGCYNALRNAGHRYRKGFMILENDIPHTVDFIVERWHYTIEPAVFEKIKAMKAEKKKSNITVKFSLPKTKLKTELRPYQKTGAGFMLAVNRCINADEMGLGKTIQALMYCEEKKTKALIVCPASLKLNWQDEIRKHVGKPSVIITSKTTEVTESDYYIINYDIFKKKLDLIKSLPVDTIILDEAHYYTYIRKPKSQRSKAILSVRDKFLNILLLTGTPMINRPAELFSLLNLINPNEYTDFWPFARRYCGLTHTRWGWDYSGASHVDELVRKLHSIMVRRLKKDVTKELPDKTYQTLEIEMTPETRKAYKKAFQDFVSFLRDENNYTDEHAKRAMRAETLVRIGKLKALVIQDKVKTLQELIESNGKFVVFCDFTEPLQKLKEEYGDLAVLHTGKQTTEERHNAIEQFQNNPDIKVFLAGTKASGTGITLTASSHVAFLSFPWTPAEYDQATDRLHRIGQKDNVTVYNLVCGDIDKHVLDVLNRKRSIIQRVIAGKRKTMRGSKSVLNDVLKKIKED